MNKLKLLLATLASFSLLSCVAVPACAADLSFGPSIRPQSYAIGLRGSGWLAPEVQFVSEGRQPDRIPNINRVLMVNAVATADLTPSLQAFIKAGLASSRWSTNGSGNGYSNPGRFGWDIGAGMTWWPTRQWGLRIEVVRMRHEQSDVPQFEAFTQATAQVVVPI
jgi:opacity protein-like surface antigen